MAYVTYGPFLLLCQRLNLIGVKGSKQEFTAIRKESESDHMITVEKAFDIPSPSDNYQNNKINESSFFVDSNNISDSKN